MKNLRATLIRLAIGAAVLAPDGVAQPRDAATWTARLGSEYMATYNVTYLTASNTELKLDVYSPRGLEAPNPVLIYFHGGGWAGGSRESGVLWLMPYLEMGFSVVNVTYRGSRVALAPAAVEDCRCALYWVVRYAKDHKFDVDKIVLTGESAGGHLALISGMLTPAAGLDRPCPYAPVQESGGGPRVAAIVNWHGPTDVGNLLEGPNAQGFAITWMGSQPGRAEIARRVSPLTYVRPDGPPVLTIHGDADTRVPHGDATRLHAELTKYGVVNQLVTIPGGGHGGYPPEQNEKIFADIRAFLGKLNLLRSSRSTG